MTVVNAPARFVGTPEQLRANYRSHRWMVMDEDGNARCLECDCKPGGVYSEWPCGAMVPRVETTLENYYRRTY